jgi:hypothetical protein
MGEVYSGALARKLIVELQAQEAVVGPGGLVPQEEVEAGLVGEVQGHQSLPRGPGVRRKLPEAGRGGREGGDGKGQEEEKG